MPDMQDVYLSISGLEESEACWVKRLVRALGEQILVWTYMVAKTNTIPKE
jgi:hypothetical protein